MLKQYAEWYMYCVICQMVGNMVLVLDHVIAQGLNLVLAIPKCLQIHENKIIYQSNTTFFIILLHSHGRHVSTALCLGSHNAF